MQLPCYPDFAPLVLDMRAEIQPLLARLPDGVSEFTFANLYLFRKRYAYHLCLAQDADKTGGHAASADAPGGNAIIISGERDGKKFFETPSLMPPKEILLSLFETHDYWKCIPDSVLKPNQALIERCGVEITEDRDNFDYLYLRTDLAELSGKKFHKKRNLVNAFLNMYIPQVEELTEDKISLALKILERWRVDKGEEGDYTASKEALELFSVLGLQGNIYYINNYPVGWCLGESLANGTMFGIHFEKGLDEYKGIYQYINQNFAASLDERYVYLNREQDLGDEGLRQAKMTYRPIGFVRKYMGKIARGD
ncbi:MAG: phosphatidylglycerol lysyltransferase domain-containing protein [Treponema sp.]|jgi:hypothetical protein|nr:phosphatidylglycerol lysyltransferase domain-containing protein [Treponema sp.]